MAASVGEFMSEVIGPKRIWTILPLQSIGVHHSLHTPFDDSCSSTNAAFHASNHPNTVNNSDAMLHADIKSVSCCNIQRCLAHVVLCDVSQIVRAFCAAEVASLLELLQL
jgi:hypothetical protein